MSRESDIINSLVGMADILVDDFDVVDLLTNLADQCVSLLEISAAGVMLSGTDGSLHLVASSSEAMRVLEVFELQAEQGPCLEAFRTGEPVVQENLRDTAQRWPLFSAAALSAGFRSALALPLRLRASTVGALNLFNVGEAPVAPANMTVARAFADLAAISIVQHHAAAEAQLLNAQLASALESRILIEQAKGVIAERAGVDVAEAFVRLRRYARSHNLRLTDVAQSAIDGNLPVDAWSS